MALNNTYKVDIKTADEILKNVFDACDKQPNIIPLEEIHERSQIGFKSENILIVISAIIFITTFLLPVFFPHGKVFMSYESASSKAIVVASHDLTDTTFSISFDGEVIDVSKSYMVGTKGTTVAPISYNRSTNTIIFPYTEDEYNIFVYDVTGNHIRLLLSPHKLQN